MQDTFFVDNINPDGKKFDKVSRIEARSEKLDLYMQLDVNTEVYPIKEKSNYVVLLTPSLNEDGSTAVNYHNLDGRGSIADKFEYIMYGKLYKISERGSGENLKTEIYLSFGGLLMVLQGNPSYVTDFHLDQNLFLCMRKL
ncbi:DNA-directed RNA polymerases II, IV and V subunit 8B-like [Carica papaya]|uniref:DNA-directed RNA polymerases II, IV and V subunit 8B-like n=1 Tax=Carica papaya TaxID=3649 RepID=UPI000B8CA817|nr:DNA-directed RNA polymerases II, IV and V subunit 8B-like [Carica papaya]